MLRGCWGPQAREEQANWCLQDTTDLQTVLWVTITGIWLLSLIFQNQLCVWFCGALLQSWWGFFFLPTIIYSCKMYLEQFHKAIKFISALFPFWNVWFSKIKGQWREANLTRFQPLFFSSLGIFFSFQITLMSETFLPMIFMTIYNSHLLVEWTGGNFPGSLLCSLCPLLHETQLSPK